MEEPYVTYSEKNIEEKIESLKNPMHVAAMRGDVEAIEAQKNFRASINQEEEGQTPLHIAVIKGKSLAVRKLISLGAKLGKKNTDGYAPLHLAVLHNRVSLIEDLVNTNTESDVDIFDKNGNTALHIAVLMGCPDAVRALLVEGANADKTNKDGNAPLHLTITQNNPIVFDVVVKFVRKPNILDKNKFRPLHLAVLFNKIDAIRKLCKLKGTNINHLNGDGDSALHLATKLRNLEAIQVLLDFKANVNVRNSKRFSSMHLALIYNDMSAPKIIERIDKANRFTNTPIHVAEAQKNVPALTLLCRSGQKVNVNIKDAFGESILHSVIKADCEDAVKLLLDLGANPNCPNECLACTSMTPLHAAVCVGNKYIIKILLESGANIHSVYGNGDMPIHLAAKFCSAVGIEAMIKHGEEIGVSNGIDLTPLDIVMSYVTENTFGTAVQKLTDLYTKKDIKRKSPLSSHEIIKSAKIVFKFEIFKNFLRSKLNDPAYQSNMIPILKSYVNDCIGEIKLMKFTLLHKKFDLYDFANKGWTSTLPLNRAYTSELALNYILNISNSNGYPIYYDMFVPYLERSALVKKVLCLRVPVTHNGKTTFLDLDAVHKYLGNEDILNLLLAYSDVDAVQGVSKSSTLKKRKASSSFVYG